MIRRPPRSTPLSLHDALPISSDVTTRALAPSFKPGAFPGVTVPSFSNDGLSAASASSEVSLRSEEHTSELQSRLHLVCRLLLEKKKEPRPPIPPRPVPQSPCP